MSNDCIPKNIEAKSQADYAALCYTYDFLNGMDAVFADWPDVTALTPETKKFIHQVERSFSKMSVYVYQLLARGNLYEEMELPELEKWPESFLFCTNGRHNWGEKLRPEPCWHHAPWYKSLKKRKEKALIKS